MFNKVDDGFLILNEQGIEKLEEQENIPKIPILEEENAELWYENIMLKSKVETTEQEIADLWYQVLTGGN